LTGDGAAGEGDACRADEPVGAAGEFLDGIEGIAANESTLVAQVGGELFISTDNAESWTQP